jgi:hypothetical protein
MRVLWSFKISPALFLQMAVVFKAVRLAAAAAKVLLNLGQIL